MAAIECLSMEFLKTRGLSRSFGGLQAVKNVDFSLHQGEIRAIIGPNGAGKTTFVSLLSGRVPASSGSVYFCGDDISNLSVHQRVRQGIAYTFQITSIFANLSVFENVATAAQNRFGEGSGDVTTYAEEALDKVNLRQMADRRASDLAYGHQRLLEVAMGLALNPRLLIFDEPTQGLSDGEIEEFCQLVRDVNQSTTVLLIEHNMQVVMSLARRITVFDQGQILAEGDPDEIQNDTAVQGAYLGT